MATLAKLFVELGLDTKGLEQGLDRATGKLKATGESFRKVGLGMSAAFTAPALAGGAALLKIGGDFDSLQDTIRVGTGKTGDDLNGLTDVALNVFKSIPTSMDAVGTALTTINQLTGITGDNLEDLTRTQLELARVTGTDLKTNVESTTKAFNQWGVELDYQSTQLDKLFRASQATGVPVATLADQLAQYGPILRQMGFDIDSSTALLGTLGKAGLDTGQVITGMRTAFKKFADEGLTDTNKALQDVFTQIKNAPDDLKAGQIAIDTFGARAGPALADSIRGGRLEYQDLLDTVLNGKDTILDSAKDTNDLAENWQIFKNRITVAVLPIATKLFDYLNKKGIPALTRMADTVQRLITRFDKLSPQVKRIALVIGAIVVAAGPLLVIFGSLLTVIGPALAALGTAFAILTGPIGLVILALVGLGIAYKKNLFGFADAVHRVIGATKPLIRFVHTMVETFRLFHKQGLGTWDALGQGISAAVDEAFGPKTANRVLHFFNVVKKLDLIGDFFDIFKRLRVGDFKGAISEVIHLIHKLGDTLSGILARAGLTNLAKAVKKTFDDIDHFMRAGVALVDDLIHGRWDQLWGDFKDVAINAVKLFIDRFYLIGALIVDVFNLIPWGTVGTALWNGLVSAVTFLVTTGVPWLAGQGLVLLTGLLSGMQEFWATTAEPWLVGLPAMMVDALSGLGKALFSRGAEAIAGLWNGASEQWDYVTDWFSKLPGILIDYFANAYNSFYSIGNYIVGGLTSGVSVGYNGLWSAGHYIMQGLYDGILWMWNNAIAPLLSQISAWIPKWKGPLERDKNMLKPAGTAIMQGLTDSIAASIPSLQKTLDRVNSTIMAAGGSPILSSEPPRLAAMAAVTGAGVGTTTADNRRAVSINFHAGSIVSNDPEKVARVVIRRIKEVEAGRT